MPKLMLSVLVFIPLVFSSQGWLDLAPGRLAALPAVAEPGQDQVPYGSGVEPDEPIRVTWDMLEDLELERRFFKEWNSEIYAPVFGEKVKALDGKEILIEGFVIPLDENGKILALSANPYASCFFCGMASHASVISLYLRDKRRGRTFKMDDLKVFRGILHLNADDPGDYYYILRDAVVE